ncbi:MAG TPA: PASTA domain-containing protein [Candidatus Acidoferrales bacterium]|jgi:beta-lactam-binding protein with PASTA domain|nr:PASTA domain-containing protein [Candidatus Acidoferrales bacterium]
MSLREQLERLMSVSLLVFILAGAAFLSAITAIRFAIHGREVEMPKLVGKSAADSQATLAPRGLGMKIADRVYSDRPVNEVVRQSPPEGVRVKVGQNAHVAISLGPRKVSIPLLVGKSLRAARIDLLRTGLQVGEISGTHLDDFPSDLVVLQDPPPGSSAVSPHVNLLVSEGAHEQAYVMPFLIGLSATEAQRQLGAAGLRAVKVMRQFAPQWPAGTVIEQKPQQGARVSPVDSVELQVAE